MRGSDALQEALFTFSRRDDFVPTNHPQRSIQVHRGDGAGHCLRSRTGPGFFHR